MRSHHSQCLIDLFCLFHAITLLVFIIRNILLYMTAWKKAVAVGAAYFEEDDAYFEQAERVLRQQIAAIDPTAIDPPHSNQSDSPPASPRHRDSLAS